MNASRAVRNGVFVALAAVLAVALLVALGLFGRDRDSKRFETYLEESAQGLSQGATVRFRGVPVGKVESLSFAWSKYRTPRTDEGMRQGRYTRVVFTVRREFLPDNGDDLAALSRFVSHGLRVFIRNQGITGLRYLDLDVAGTNAATQNLPFSWKPENFYIPAAPSLGKTFQSLLESVGAQLSGVDFRSSLDHLAALVSNADAAVGAVRLSFEEQTPVFEQTMVSLRNASGALESLVERLRDDPGLLLRAPDDE